ncbi:MAG: TonB-dependent receptor [Gammaproteobacteria bacterium]|nr:TonB-dependent receptor [Gammaproteobacteria bacterium]
MLRIAILLLVVTGIHGAPALADETSGHAQTQEENEHTPAGGASLEEIRVTAHPFSETDEHMVRPAQVLSKEELRTRSISSIGETVANEPGVTSSDYGTGVGRPVIRGQSGNRVLILEDGLSTMDAGSFSADHAVTTETILSQQVEILSGPATLLYGSGGSGGIINVVKGRILDYVPDDVEGEVALQYETVSDGMTGAGRLNFGVGNFAFHIDGMARDTDNYNIPGFAELEPGESTRGTLANSSRKTENISGGLSWVGARGYAGFSVSRYENEYGIPGHHHHDHGHGHEHGHDDHDDHDDHGHDDEDEHHDDDDDHGHDDEDEHHDDDDDHGHDDEDEHHDDDDDHGHDDEDGHDDEEEEGGARIEMEQTRYDFVAALDNPLPGLSRVKMRWGYSDYKHVEGEEGAGTLFDNEEVEGRVEFLHNPIGGWFGAVGFHYRHQDFLTDGPESFVPLSELESFGVFVLEKTDIGPVHIELGARFEHQDSSAETETGDKNSYDLFNASGGLNWDYAPGYQVGLSFGHSERAPALGELYADGPHLATTTFEIGDTGLAKEKSNNVDIYWRKTAGKLTVSANFFYNRIDDYIYYQEQDLNGDGFADRVTEFFGGNPANILAPGVDEELFLVYISQDDAEFLGFEAETRARLMDDNNGRMVLRLWADYVEGERSNNTNLARITPWRFGSGLTYSRGDLYAAVNYTRVNKQDSTAPLETETDGYHLLDVHAEYTFRTGGNRVTLFARGSNLLDEEIRRHVSFVKDQAPLPGRSGIFGVRVGF